MDAKVGLVEALMSSGNVVLVFSMILIVAIVAARSSSRFGTPTLLLFLLVGMLFGSDGLGVEFYNPNAAQFIGMLSLSVILFSGGMDTKYSEIKPIMAEGIVLATVGVLLTAALTGGFIYFIGKLFGAEISLAWSFLLAAVMSSTDSASVFSILRSKRQGLKQNLRPLLELESGSNDPMAYILTIILVEAVVNSGAMNVWGAMSTFVVQMSVGAVAGYLLGRGAVYLLNHINLNNKSLYSVLLLAVVYFIFSFTDLLNGNGYLAVYIAGLVVGNYKVVYQKSLTTFFDGYTWLFQIVMFITLGLLVNPHEILDVLEIGLLVSVFMLLVARPASVLLCLAPFRKLTAKAKIYVSWVGLRGAVPIIFATYPWVAGVENADMIFNTVFLVTIVSLLVQGTTVSSMANRLGLSMELEGDSFGIDIPDEIKAQLNEVEISEDWLVHGNHMRDIKLAENTLVMMIRRGDDYIVPKGDTELYPGDKMLCITEEQAALPDDYAVSHPLGWRGRAEAFVARLRKKAKSAVRRSGDDDESDAYIAADSPGVSDNPGDPRFDEDIMDDTPNSQDKGTK